MDITFIVLLWIIISVVQALDRKKTPPPDSSDFEIPPLQQSPQVEEINLAEVYRQKKISATKQVQEQADNATEETKTEIEITPASAMNAIILGEILDKPKALRKKKF